MRAIIKVLKLISKNTFSYQEREYNELSVEAKSTARDLKRAEERLAHAIEARKAAEQKAGELTTELGKLRPEHELATKDAERLRTQLDKLTKIHEVVQAEVDRYVINKRKQPGLFSLLGLQSFPVREKNG